MDPLRTSLKHTFSLFLRMVLLKYRHCVGALSAQVWASKLDLSWGPRELTSNCRVRPRASSMGRFLNRGSGSDHAGPLAGLPASEPAAVPGALQTESSVLLPGSVSGQ